MTARQWITRRRFLRATAAGMSVLIGSLLSACGGAPPRPAEAPAQSAASSTSAAQSSAAATKAAPAPPTGGNWSLPLLTDPVMNPVIAQGRESNWTNAFLFNMLVKPGKDNPVELVPDLAKSWEKSKDGLVWTFQLRSDVKWHDGEKFTADDVKFTFDKILDPKTNTRLRSDLKPIDKVEVVDPQTVRFHLKEPYGPLLTFLGYTAGIVPKHALQDKDINTASEFNSKKPIGTGPFKIRSYTSASEVVLEANPDYFLGRPRLDSVTLKVMPDVNTMVAQLNTGGLDYAPIEPFALGGVKGNPNLEVVSAEQVVWWHLSPNTTLPMFSDKRVRQALTYALDREAISKNVSGGAWPVQATPIAPFLKPWYNPEVKPYPYDQAKALELLKASDWTKGSDGILRKDGQPFKFTLVWGKISGREEIGVLVHQYWRDLGLDVKVEGFEWSAMLSRFGKRDYEVFLDRWVAPYEPDMTNYFHSSAAKTGKNSPVYSNPEVDKLLDTGRAATDQEERRKIYFKFQELIREEQPEIFLFWQPDTQVRNKAVGGIPKIATLLGDPFNYAHEFYRVK